MSLINDALKRAQEEKSRNPMEPELLMTPVQTGKKPRNLRLTILACAGLALVAGVVGGVKLFKKSPAPATAAPLVTTPAPTAAIPAGRTAANRAVVAPSPRGKKTAKAQPLVTPQQAQRSLENVFFANLGKAGVDLAADFAARAKKVQAHKPAAKESAKVAAAPAKTKPAATPAPAVQKPAAPFDAGRYKLSAILLSDNATAVINGEFVKVGETIEEAKVVKIDRYSVELDYGGQHFTLRM